MSLFIETPRLARFRTMEEVVLGPFQKKALDLLHKHKGRKPVAPKAGTFTSTGKMRKHILDDLVGKQYAVSKFNRKLGGMVYLITSEGERVRRIANIAKAPASGYRKVRPGRPAKANGTKRRVA